MPKAQKDSMLNPLLGGQNSTMPREMPIITA